MVSLPQVEPEETALKHLGRHEEQWLKKVSTALAPNPNDSMGLKDQTTAIPAKC